MAEPLTTDIILERIDAVRRGETTKLDLSGSEVTDLSVISDLTALKELKFRDTKISDLRSIKGLINLRILDLMGTKVSDLTPLTQMRKLDGLYLDNTPVVDLRPIMHLTGLGELSLGRTTITDIAPLADLPNISFLYLDHTEIADISALSRLDNLGYLNLSTTKVTDLTPIAGLKKLHYLNLSDSLCTNVNALSGLSGLQFLYIKGTAIQSLDGLPQDAVFKFLNFSKTKVTDLRPLRDLQFTEDAKIRFTDCAATKADPHLAEIAAIGDAGDRFKALMEYLENLPPDDLSEPDDTDLFPTNIDDGKLETAQSTPTEAEVDDTLKQTLHQRLIADTAALADAAQNQYGQTYQKAKLLSERLKRPFADLDMVNIHLDVEALQSLKERGAESELSEPFSQTMLDAFNGVLLSGPGLTLDNPDVEKLLARIRRFQASPPPADTQAKHDALSEATANDPDAIGENLRGLEKRAIDTETPAEKIAIQDPAHRGILVRLGRLAIAGTITGGTVVIGAAAVDVAKAPIVNYVNANLPTLWDVAALYGVQFQAWFGMALAEVKELAGPLAAIDYKPVKRKDD